MAKASTAAKDVNPPLTTKPDNPPVGGDTPVNPPITDPNAPPVPPAPIIIADAGPAKEVTFIGYAGLSFYIHPGLGYPGEAYVTLDQSTGRFSTSDPALIDALRTLIASKPAESRTINEMPEGK